MKTTQTVNVAVNSTYRVSVRDWRGKTCVEVYENETDSVEIRDIDTEEMLTTLLYYISNLAKCDDKTPGIVRRLTDIQNTLNDLLRTKESEVTSNA